MKKVLFVLFTLYSVTGHSQCSDITIKSRIYPEICVENAISWLNMSRSEWQSEMNKYDFSKNGNCEGSPCFYTSSELNGSGVLYAVTKEFGRLRIENIPLETKRSIFQNIIDQLEPYFINKMGNWNYFRFEYSDGKQYEFALNESSNMDLLWVTIK